MALRGTGEPVNTTPNTPTPKRGFTQEVVQEGNRCTAIKQETAQRSIILPFPAAL